MPKHIGELFGTQYPVVQGGMAWVANASLASAVSMGGGLGVIAAGNAPVEYVKQQIDLVRAKTDKPFGVNIMLMSPSADEVAQLVLQERVPVVTTGAGNPGKYMQGWKEAGCKVVPVVASVALALRMQRSGADALVAEGCEAGGHIGDLTTMTLLPQVADAVNIPVIAAGGIADGRGVAAVMMLGASGVQIGTRFLLADECTVHQNFKDLVLKARDLDTTVTGRYTGHPVRVLKNRLARQGLELEREHASVEEFEEFFAGGLRVAVVEGDLERGSFMAGQSAGLCKKTQPAAEIIRELMDEGMARAKRAAMESWL